MPFARAGEKASGSLSLVSTKDRATHPVCPDHRDMLDCATAASDPWARAPIILQPANSWHDGDAIPPELRHYRKSPGDLPDPLDSENLIAKVTNLALLAAIVTDTAVD